MISDPVPEKLDLKKDEKLEIVWKDGRKCVYPLSFLRSMCPCAACKTVREGNAGQKGGKGRLTILPGNYSAPLTVEHAELVGNYAHCALTGRTSMGVAFIHFDICMRFVRAEHSNVV